MIQYPLMVGRVVTRVLEAGDGDDMVVCLHGAGSRADRWRPAMELLAQAGRHCFALDYPGHGLAAKPPGYPYGCAAFSEFVADYLATVADRPVHVAGTSIGGYIAGRAALERPDLVASLCLIGAVGLAPVERPPTPPTGDVARTDRAAIRAKLEFLVHDDSLVTETWVTEEWRINSSPGATEALAALQRDNDRPRSPIGLQVASLGIPTMLLWGADDRWIPAVQGHACHAVMPESPLFLMRDAGHAPYFERPADFVDTYLKFLDDPASLGHGVATI